MRTILRGALAALILSAMGATAQAADLPAIKAPPPPPAFVDVYQPFQIRVRASAVVPDSGGATIYDAGGVSPALGGFILPAVGLSGGPGSVVPGASTNVSWSVIPEVDVTYFLTKNIAIEAICCISRHHVQGVGTLFGSSLARTWVFPPSLIFQYHFTNFGAFQPYVGVGVNFTAYFSEAGNNLWFLATPNAGVVPATFTSLSITPSWGVVGQVGFDYMFNETWGVNVDLKRILMEPNAHGQIFSPVAGGLYVPVNAKVTIDPWIASVGVTYRFGAGMVQPVLAKY
jgi:outer membrane protein W